MTEQNKSKPKQELLQSYIEITGAISDSQRELLELQQLISTRKAKAEKMEHLMLQDRDIAMALTSTGIRTINDQFLHCENGKISVRKFKPVPCMWELDK